MQKLAEICIRRPVFATMIVLSLVVVGAASFFRLGVDRFPSVDLPTVSVRTSLPGAAPEEVESLVTQQIEEVVNTVDGIDELRSISGQGTSFVIATFKLDRDLDTAAQDVRDRVATVVRQLPEDATPPVVQKFDNDSTPVITIALSADRSLRELTELADKTVRVQLERIGGVGEVRVVGGLDRAINIWIDAERLAAYQIPITAIRQALARQNADVPGGNVNTGHEELVLRTLGRYADSRAFEDLVIANVNGSPIRLRDVGRVEDGTKEQRSLSRLNGVPTVSLEIRRQSGANTIEVINGIKRELPRVAAQLPDDVKLEIIRDQSRYIESALHEIETHLDSRQYSGQSGGLRLHAFVALDADRRSRYSLFGDLDFRHDASARLHAEQRDDAGTGVDGGRGDRRRHRRAGKHLPLHRRKADESEGGGERSNERHRPGCDGNHVFAGGYLPARLLHVVDLRTLSLSVWHHCGGRDPGQFVGLLYADADDEFATDSGGRRRAVTVRLLRGVAFIAGSTAVIRACSALRCDIGWQSQSWQRL